MNLLMNYCNENLIKNCAIVHSCSYLPVIADVLWVGLGLLKQERWIEEHIGKIKVSRMIGVGAAFDFHSGTVKKAPRYFRNVGLE